MNVIDGSVNPLLGDAIRNDAVFPVRLKDSINVFHPTSFGRDLILHVVVVRHFPLPAVLLVLANAASVDVVALGILD